MKVTGYLLREAIRRRELRRDTAANQFEDSLSKFADEDKQTPDELAAIFVLEEKNIAKLQAVQDRYNLKVEVDVLGEKITLGEAIKRLGGAGRLDKMWRGVTTGRRDRYGYRDENTRKADEERARPTVTAKEAMDRATKASVVAGAMRAAIAKGNGTEIESDVLLLDQALLSE
jgi:hypothetical protein